MELKELKKKSEKDLHRLLAESRDKLRELRFKDANKQLKNVREIRGVKRLISRIITLLNINMRKDIKDIKEEPKKPEDGAAPGKDEDGEIKNKEKKLEQKA